MSDDLGDLYRAHKRDKQERHRKAYEDNMLKIKESGIVYIDHGTVLHVADFLFYPHTGRWQERGSRHMYRGGAQAFLSWYKER